MKELSGVWRLVSEGRDHTMKQHACVNTCCLASFVARHVRSTEVAFHTVTQPLPSFCCAAAEPLGRLRIRSFSRFAFVRFAVGWPVCVVLTWLTASLVSCVRMGWSLQAASFGQGWFLMLGCRWTLTSLSSMSSWELWLRRWGCLVGSWSKHLLSMIHSCLHPRYHRGNRRSGS